MRLFRVALLLVALLMLRPAPARAEVIDGPVIAVVVGLGNVAALSTSVAAIVYAVDGRAFDDPWVVAALFSSAICGATTVAIGIDGLSQSDGPGLGIVLALEAALTIWPAYWTVRSALSEVDPGEKFDAEVAPKETRDPENSARLPSVPSHFSFGGSF